MEPINCIKTRRTIRRFKQKTIPRTILENIIDCARLAPSANNMQPLSYIIIDDKKTVAHIFTLTRWAGRLGSEGPPPEGKRPVVFIAVMSDMHTRSDVWYTMDIGAACENILLAAHSMGIGTAWLGAVQFDKAADVLNIDARYEINSLIALGYPDEISETVTLDPTQENAEAYYKKEDGTMQVPKRSIQDILSYHRDNTL